MIVKNEAESIGRCIASVRGVADRVIVVDTGSTDGTPTIAERLGARVIHRNWRDDFSHARNESLNAARTPWVIVLDADEELAPGAAQPLRELVANDPAGPTLVFATVSSVDDAGGTQQTISPRIASNLPGLRYQRPVHEEWLWVGEGQLRQQVLPTIRIHHYGYTAAERTRQGKWDRNLRMLFDELAAKPGDLVTLFYLGQEYAAHGRLSDAIAVYEARLASMCAAFPPLVATHAVYGYVGALISAGLSARARAVSTEWARKVDSPTMWMQAANAALQDGDVEAAESLARTAHQSRGPAFGIDLLPRSQVVAAACVILGDAATARGNAVAGERLYRQALDTQADSTHALVRVAESTARGGDVEGARQILNDALAIRPRDPNMTICASRIDRAAGDLQAALDRLANFVADVPYLTSTRLELAETLIAGGENAIAADVLSAALDTPQLASSSAEFRANYFARYGDALTATGKLVEAVTAYQMAVDARLAAGPIPSSAGDRIGHVALAAATG